MLVMKHGSVRARGGNADQFMDHGRVIEDTTPET